LTGSRPMTSPAPREQPDDHRPGKHLDHTVGTEADQGHRTCGDPRADSDGELDQMPSVPARRASALDVRAALAEDPRAAGCSQC
jgi:hypothetical protein